MKSITTPMVLMTLLTSFSLSAQTKIGFSAGASFANVTVKSQGISGSPKGKTGIIAGLLTDAPLGENFSFQPALNFVQKGYIIKNEPGTPKVTFNYLEVPLNFVYKTKRNEGFFIGAGPSIAYGVSGRNKMADQNEKIYFGPSDNDVKHFDFGANAVAGYLFKGGFMISGNYNLGLGKINNADGSGGDGTIKNRYFGIKIGYLLGSKK